MRFVRRWPPCATSSRTTRVPAPRAWVFDLDGTLTRAVHDFDAMRQTLGLAPGTPILEGLRAMEPEARVEAERVVAAWEIAHAELGQPAEGAVALLSALRAAQVPVGVLTRNLRTVALRTLEVSGLHGLIDPHHVLGREEAAPKPAPDGLHLLLERLSARANEAVMVGDHVDDARCGRAAGATAVIVREALPLSWHAHVDLHVPSLRVLHALWLP